MNLNEPIVIKLNRHWQIFEILSAKEAVVFLSTESKGQPNGYAMDFESVQDENGKWRLVHAASVVWDDWINLPVSAADVEANRFITTGRGRIRLPKVVICARYDKVPTRNPRWSVGNVWKRDGGVCQITKKKLTRGQGNIGHNRARALGGENTFENTIVMDAQLNTIQGTKTFAEMGWTLARTPKTPPSMPVVYRKADAPLPEQTPFFID